MTRYYVEIGCTVRSASGDLEDHFSEVMDALLEEPGAVDPDISAELATGNIALAMSVDAETDRDALSRALVVARSAIHKAGGFTPDWTDRPHEGKFFVTADGFDARVRPVGANAC
ncbi:hypothetical protein OHS58_39250 [Amycolatopsis sp. NBC_00348]|uniref:hypothetical protein n=1 Tax=Amycolatopsis sp. NBC_00348 TaxID=2975956 RepID=UPI002E2527E7